MKKEKTPKIQILGTTFDRGGRDVTVRFDYSYKNYTFTLGQMPRTADELMQMLKELYEQNKPQMKPKFKIPEKIDW